MSTTESNILVRRITELSDPNIESAVQILSEGYRNDPICQAMIGHHDEYRVDMFRGIIPAYILGGQCYIVLNATGKVVGTATWYAPGNDFLCDAPSKKALEPFFTDMKKRYPDLHEFWFSILLPGYWASTKFFPEVKSQQEGNFKFHNWNILGLATSPIPQRQDVEIALLKVGLDEAAKTNAVVCAESESDIQYNMYLQAGFRLLGEEFVDGSKEIDSYKRRSLILN